MTRLVAATISLVWAAAFAGLSTLCLFAADRGASSAVSVLGLPAAVDPAAWAGRPVFAGLSLGAAIVASLFATVALSSALNGPRHLSQDGFIADMAFGGAAGLLALAAISLLANAGSAEIGGLVLVALALAASFRASRWALRAPAPPAPAPARLMAAEAAANTNVVPFPLKPTGTAGRAR